MQRSIGRFRSKILSVVVVLGVVAAGLVAGFGPSPAPANAANANLFNPGYIISDAEFYNGAAMTEAQIQAFLVQRGSVLANYRTNSTTRPARVDSGDPSHVYCNAHTGGTNLLASTIIYRAQVACGISAKALLVTLQKEQSLISLATASDARLDRAMGYACPDTAPCNPANFGFANQVYMASLQFKFYKRPQNGFNFQPGTRYITYSPANALPEYCRGLGSDVTIANWATAGLYNYTPYQPNAAALSNLYGTGDVCSAYGNRNFWVFYSDWFGSPTGQVNPIGSIDSVTSPAGSTVNVRGWAFDYDTQASLSIHAYVNGRFVAGFTANGARPDVNSAHPSQKGDYGFNNTLRVAPGTHSVCLYALNVLYGQNTALGCRTVTVGKEAPAEPAATASGAVYRFWSSQYQGHFYTRSVAERDKIITQMASTWTYEGPNFGAFGTAVQGTVPVYRFWSEAYKGHFYTTSEAERDQVIASYPDDIWKYETIAFYAYPNSSVVANTRAVSRFWSTAYNGHFYTASAAESQQVQASYPDHVWAYEGEKFRVPVAVPAPAPLP